MKLRMLTALIGSAAVLSAAPAAAAITTYGSQANFQAALDGSFTLVNLDSATFTVFGSGWNLDDAGPAAALLALGLDSVGYNADVVSGQNFQTPTNRDWLI